jgi:hypothetical protein
MTEAIVTEDDVRAAQAAWDLANRAANDAQMAHYHTLGVWNAQRLHARGIIPGVTICTFQSRCRGQKRVVAVVAHHGKIVAREVTTKNRIWAGRTIQQLDIESLTPTAEVLAE